MRRTAPGRASAKLGGEAEVQRPARMDRGAGDDERVRGRGHSMIRIAWIIIAAVAVLAYAVNTRYE